MAQIHCYIPDQIASQLSKKARKNHLSVSKYLASLVRKDISAGWPTGYFEQVFGCWEGDKSLQRPKQGEYEHREGFE